MTHSALIHVDAHLILITKMQFPASQHRLMGRHRSQCFFVQRHASSRIDDFHTDRGSPHAYLSDEHSYDELAGWLHIHEKRLKMTAFYLKHAETINKLFFLTFIYLCIRICLFYNFFSYSSFLCPLKDETFFESVCVCIYKNNTYIDTI